MEGENRMKSNRQLKISKKKQIKKTSNQKINKITENYEISTIRK